MLRIRSALARRPLNGRLIAEVAGLYLCNRLALQSVTAGWLHVFCKNHLNDLICPLLFLSVAEVLFIMAGREQTAFPAVFIVGLAAGLIWEYVGPIINPRSTSDPLDLLCYCAGTCLYYGLLWLDMRRSAPPNP